MTHCIYCGKETDGEYCSERCRQETIKFQKKAEKNAKWLILGIVLSLLIMPASYLAGLPYMAIFCLAGIGVTFIIFPYGTPTTNSWGGVKRGVMYVRAAAIAMCLVAISMSYLFSM